MIITYVKFFFRLSAYIAMSYELLGEIQYTNLNEARPFVHLSEKNSRHKFVFDYDPFYGPDLGKEFYHHTNLFGFNARLFNLITYDTTSVGGLYGSYFEYTPRKNLNEYSLVEHNYAFEKK